MTALWLISFLFILESFSGIVIISILLPTITVLYALRINNKVRRIISSTFIIAFTSVVATTLIWRIKEYQFSPIANQKMLDVTEIGSPYFHDTTAWSFKQLENGNYEKNKKKIQQWIQHLIFNPKLNWIFQYIYKIINFICDLKWRITNLLSALHQQVCSMWTTNTTSRRKFVTTLWKPRMPTL